MNLERLVLAAGGTALVLSGTCAALGHLLDSQALRHGAKIGIIATFAIAALPLVSLLLYVAYEKLTRK